MRRYVALLMMCACLVGCSNESSKTSELTTGTDVSPPSTVDAVASSPLTPADQQDADTKAQAAMVDTMFGKIELREWPNLTSESIGKRLESDLVKVILRVDHPVTAEKDEYGPQWKYSWASPGNKEKGSVKVEILMDNQSPTSMKIQAGVRQKLAEQGTGTEVDLSRYGVVAVYRTKRGTNDLQICTAKKLIVINTKNMRGPKFKDTDKMKLVAAELATALFEAHAKD